MVHTHVIDSLNINQLPGYVYCINTRHEYLCFNELFSNLIGLAPKTEGTLWPIQASQVPEEEWQQWKNNNQEVLIQHQPQTFFEWFTLPTGERITVVSEKKALYGQDGLLIGLINISLLSNTNYYVKEIEKKNADLMELLSVLMDSMPAQLFWVDRNNVYLGCNSEHARLANMSPMDIIGKTNFDLPWRAEAAQLNEINDLIMESKKSLIREESGQLADQSIATFLTIKSPIINSQGEVTGLIGISIDITERKQIEDELMQSKLSLEKANKIKTEFLENMRHDIRTPLQGIIGFAELIASGTMDSSDIKLCAQKLTLSCQELLKFLNEILESINIGSGDTPLLRTRFMPEELFNRLFVLFQSKAIAKGLSFKLEMDSNIPKYCVGDPIRIYRVCLELISNALKFTKTGDILLSVVLTNKSKREIVICINIEDTGIGMSEENQKELFLQFKRATPSFKGIYKGRGLGLANVRQLIDELQGEIYVFSQSGAGTRVQLFVPLLISLTQSEICPTYEIDI